jgi:hypothetical protein
MPISSQLLERYAKSFAVAFPDYADRQRMAMVAEVSGTAQVAGTPLDSWRDILHCAHESGTLLQLVGAAASLRPHNRAISNLHGILAGRDAERSSVKKTFVMILLFGLGALILVWTNVVQVESASLEASIEELVIAELPTSIEPESALPPLTTEPGASEETISAPLPIPIEVPESVTDIPVEPSDDAAAISGRCGGDSGSIVGYFYVGEGIDSVAGETHVMTTSAYVRGDYPRRENGWDFTVAATCALNPGDRVILRDDPILVDGDKYWVALYGESLLME